VISREAQKFIDSLSTQRMGEPPTLEQWRRDWDGQARARPLPPGVHASPVSAAGVECEWIDVEGADTERVFVLLHGGGYNAGSPATHRKLAILLGDACHCRVLTPDYRLAPEHPFPAAVEDVLRAYDWLTGEAGLRPAQIFMGGDSAGGGMTLSVLLALREAGKPMPRAAVLISPWTDLTTSSPSYTELRDKDVFVTADSLVDGARWYAGTRNPADPELSPLFADLHGLPRMLIHVGGNEVMLDDSRLLAERAQAAGVDVTCRVWPGLWHCFPLESPDIPEAAEAVAEIGRFVRSL
jgi:monoterpene epsilon-lactone hydrolase